MAHTPVVHCSFFFLFCSFLLRIRFPRSRPRPQRNGGVDTSTAPVPSASVQRAASKIISFWRCFVSSIHLDDGGTTWKRPIICHVFPAERALLDPHGTPATLGKERSSETRSHGTLDFLAHLDLANDVLSVEVIRSQTMNHERSKLRASQRFSTTQFCCCQRRLRSTKFLSSRGSPVITRQSIASDRSLRGV